MRNRSFTTVGWEKYLIPTNPFVEKFLEINGNDVLWQIAQNIWNANKNNKHTCVFVVHNNAGSVVLIEKKDYITVLNYCISWFVKKELYERCVEIEKFKSDLIKKTDTRKLMQSPKQKKLI